MRCFSDSFKIKEKSILKFILRNYFAFWILLVVAFVSSPSFAKVIPTVLGNVNTEFNINSHTGRNLANVELESESNNDGGFDLTLTPQPHSSNSSPQPVHGSVTATILQSIQSGWSSLPSLSWLTGDDIAAALTVLEMPQNAHMPQLNENLQVSSVSITPGGQVAIALSNTGESGEIVTGTLTFLQVPANKKQYGHIMVQAQSGNNLGSFIIDYGQDFQRVVFNPTPPAPQDDQDHSVQPESSNKGWSWAKLNCFSSGGGSETNTGARPGKQNGKTKAVIDFSPYMMPVSLYLSDKGSP